MGSTQALFGRKQQGMGGRASRERALHGVSGHRPPVSGNTGVRRRGAACVQQLGSARVPER